MNTENNNSVISEDEIGYEIKISELITAVLSKFWILILVGLVAAVGAYYYTAEMTTPLYQSTARVYILNRQSSLSTSMNDLSSAVTLKDDFKVLIKSNEVSRQVLESIGEDSSNYKSVKGQVSLDNNETRFVDITVTDKDPVRAKLLVDAYAKVARKKAIEIMGVEDITIEEYGEIPSSPTSPSMSRNIVMAVAVGIVLACAVILLLHLMNNTVKTPEDIEKAIGVCFLGSIPDISLLRRQKPRNLPKKQKPNEKS